MNCLEFRRLRLGDPLQDDEELGGHEANCASCHCFATEMRQLERALRAAIAIEPPDRLEERTILRQVLTCEKVVSRRRFLVRAAATFACLIAAGAVIERAWRDPVASEIIAHAKPSNFAAEQPASAQQVAHVLRNIGQSSPRSALNVLYVSNCTIGRHLAAHLVLSHDGQAVNVFLMPMIAAASTELIREDRYVGQIRTFGSGSIAIVAERSEHLAPTYQVVTAALGE